MDNFNDISSPRALLATRRSGKARDMTEPGPDAAQLARYGTTVTDYYRYADELVGALADACTESCAVLIVSDLRRRPA